MIGGGVAGVCTAYHLARAGRSVVLLEQAVIGAPPPQSSSGDRARLFRSAYGNRAHMTRLCIESRDWWRRFEEASGEELLVPQPMVVFGARGPGAVSHWDDPGTAGWAQDSDRTMRALGEPSELLSKSALRDRYPAIADSPAYDHAVVDHTAGYFHAAAAVRAVARLAADAGVDIREHAPVDEVLRRHGDVYGVSCGGASIEPIGSVVFAAGAANLALVPELRPKVRITRQQIALLAPAADGAPNLEELPTVVALNERRYVYPIRDIGFAVADDDNRGPAVAFDQLPIPAGADAEFVAVSEAFVRRVLLGLPQLEVLEAKACIYSNTADEEYLIDRLGNAVVISACSGHGFKNGPMTGLFAARLAEGRHIGDDTERFALDRARDY